MKSEAGGYTASLWSG